MKALAIASACSWLIVFPKQFQLLQPIGGVSRSLSSPISRRSGLLSLPRLLVAVRVTL